MKEYSIASIAGDGIGKEVVPEAQKILKEISQQHQFKLKIEDYDFASCDYYEKHGKMMPDDWNCLLYTSPSPRDKRQSRMPSSA